MIKEGLFPDIQSAVTEYTCEQVQTEMKCYAAIEESVMRKSSAAEMESFSFAVSHIDRHADLCRHTLKHRWQCRKNPYIINS
jgi:hypothetical protein